MDRYMAAMKPFIRAFLCALPCFFFATGTAAAQTKIACIGNSITYGYGLSSPATQAYPARLQTLLGTVNYNVQNEGVNATTMSKNAKAGPTYWTGGRLPQTFAFQPSIITIMLGTNDTKPGNWDSLGYGTQYQRDYLAMVDTLAAMASHPRIYVVLPVPVFSNPQATNWGIRDSVVQKIIPIIRQVAVARGLTVIDANTPLKNFPQYFSVDGVHPNAAGEDTIARVIFRALTTAVNPRENPARYSFPAVVTRGGSIVITTAEGGRTSVALCDIRGRQVARQELSGTGPHTITHGAIRSGIYLLSLASARTGRVLCRKIEIVN
jgi:acyl-CoA thioesterase I